MPIDFASAIQPSEITPREIWLRRRELLAGAAALGLAGTVANRAEATPLTGVASAFSTDEKPTPLSDITSYNNFYEFGTDKEDPAANAHTLTHQPLDASRSTAWWPSRPNTSSRTSSQR